MVNTTIIKSGPYVIGSNTAFTFSFRYFGGDVKVALLNSSLVTLAVLTEGTDYTVTTTDQSAGGTVNKVTDWVGLYPTAVKVLIYRSNAIKQLTDFRNGDILDAEVLESAVDKSVALLQELYEAVTRMMLVPMADSGATLTLPPAAVRANNMLGFDSSGNAVAANGQSPVNVSTDWASIVSGALAASWKAALAGTLGPNWATALFLTLGTALSSRITASTLDADTLGGNAAAAFLGVAATAADAAKVSAYGIGAIKDLGTAYNLDNLKTNGVYACDSPTYSNGGGSQLSPTLNSRCVVIVEMQSATYGIQKLTWVNGFTSYLRLYVAGAWWGWYAEFNSYSDGNGGQPPAPKAGGSAQGKINACSVDLSTNDTYANGTSTAGGAGETWMYFVLRIVTATNAVDFVASGTAAGNTVIISGVAGKFARGFAWRQS